MKLQRTDDGRLLWNDVTGMSLFAHDATGSVEIKLEPQEAADLFSELMVMVYTPAQELVDRAIDTAKMLVKRSAQVPSSEEPRCPTCGCPDRVWKAYEQFFVETLNRVCGVCGKQEP